MATTPAELRALLISLSDDAEADLAAVWAQLTPATFYDALMDLIPALVGDYGDAAAALTAEWYDEHREELNVSGRFSADVPADPKLGGEALAGWASALARENVDTALTRTSGGLVKRIFTASRDTLTIATEQDPQARGWQRAGRGECTFCRVLISRGAVYTKASVNFGAHDDCKCVAVPAFGGRALPVKPYTPSARTINDADKARVKAWMAANLGYRTEPLAPATPAPSDIGEFLAAEKAFRLDGDAWLDAEQARRTPRPLTEDEGRDLGRTTWLSHADSLPSNQRQAVVDYTDHGYMPMNEHLRTGRSATEEIRRNVELVDSAIDSAPRVPEPVTVSRAVGADIFGLTANTDITSIIGRSFEDRGFMSTALQTNLTHKPDRNEVELRLDIPSGTRALYVSSRNDGNYLSVYGTEENELLIGRGAQYEIIGALMEGDRRVLTARLTGQEARTDE